MKKYLSGILLSILVLVLITATCSCRNSQTDSKADEPSSLTTETPVESEGFAGKDEMLYLSYNDAEAYVYFDLNQRKFIALLKNLSNKPLSDTAFVISLKDKSVSKKSEATIIRPNQEILLEIDFNNIAFSRWSASLVHDGSQADPDEPEIKHLELYENEEAIKIMEKTKTSAAGYDIIPNIGTIYNNQIFAGRNQRFIFIRYGIEIDLQYNAESKMFEGIMKNYNTKSLPSFNLLIQTDTDGINFKQTINSLEPEEIRSLSILNSRTEPFQIWRIYFSIKDIADENTEIIIKDVD